MYKILLTLLILNYITNFSSNAAKCLTDQDDWCVFNKISITELFTQFYPSAKTPSNVEKIKFHTSRLHTFSNKICERFLNLEKLDLSSVLLRKIDADGFHHCIKLKWLNLSNNQLTEIDSILFTNNKNLELIDLHGNYLKEIDLSLLMGLTHLMSLDVSRNRLQAFSIYKSPKLNQLGELYLQYNELTELNENALVHNFPNLEKLGIEGNLMHCKRVEEMLIIFAENGIESVADMGNNKNVDCLSEQQWSRLPCEKRLAAIRDEWIWLKKQMQSEKEEISEEE